MHLCFLQSSAAASAAKTFSKYDGKKRSAESASGGYDNGGGYGGGDDYGGGGGLGGLKRTRFSHDHDVSQTGSNW